MLRDIQNTSRDLHHNSLTHFPMKTTLPKTPSSHLLVRRTAVLAACTALHMVPCLFAQTEAPKPAQPAEAQQSSTKLYSMKFSGGSVEAMSKELKAAFPKDNVVVSSSLQHLNGHGIGEFEVRDVRLKELGRTIEFLSDGKLIVEVVESEDGSTGNIWRFGSLLANTPASVFTLQMRSVAAPYLFRDKEKAERVGKDATNAEAGRLKRILETTRAGYNDIVGGARVELLPDQHLFVIVGSEAGIAGMEGFIKAAEQLAMEEVTKKEALAASLTPKMRAVLAPHLFNNPARLDRVTKECEEAQKEWLLSYHDVNARVGLKDGVSLVHAIRVVQRPDQKLFMLIGLEDGIAGIETLIQAAEKNAANEDAMLLAEDAKKAKIVDLEKQLNFLERSLTNEKELMVRRQRALANDREEATKALGKLIVHLQLRDAKDLSEEQLEQLIAEKEASIKNFDRMLAEGDPKSISQIDQLSKAVLDAKMRLEAAHSRAK